MAVAANIEWKVETALISVLDALADLAACNVVRGGDSSAEPDYPCVVVSCGGARDEDWAVLSDYSYMLVDVTVITDTKDDVDGQLATRYLGACRDAVYAAGFVLSLTNAVSGLTVHGVTVEDAMAEVTNETRFRRRSMTLGIHATASH